MVCVVLAAPDDTGSSSDPRALGLFIVALSVALTMQCLHSSRKLSSWLGKRWVKALDFPYLLFGFIGLLKIAKNTPGAHGEDFLKFLDTAGVVFVAIALAIRLTKATIEVCFDHWVRDKPLAALPQ